MPNAAEYVVVVETFVDSIAKSVNARIAEGWQPHGSLQMTWDAKHANMVYAQAMIKPAE
jgi:hypothetical protein